MAVVSPVNIAHALATQYIIIFDLLEGAMVLLLGAMLAIAFFSARIYRGRTWYAFIASMIIGSISYLLLVGRQGSVDPPFALCLVQASAIYASNPFISFAAFSLILEPFVNLYAAIHSRPRVNVNWIRAMVAIPVLIYGGIFGWVASIGLRHPHLVAPNSPGMFCHVDRDESRGFVNPFMISAALTSFGQVFVIVTYGLSIHTLITHRKRTGVLADDTLLTLPLFIRWATLMVTLNTIGIVMASISYIRVSDTAIWCLALPIAPLSVVVILGTQADLLGVVFPCCVCKLGFRNRRRRRYTEMGLASSSPNLDTVISTDALDDVTLKRDKEI